MSRLYSTKILSLAALSAVLLSTSALGADVYTGSSKDAPAQYAPDSGGMVNWSGFYIGGAIGYGNSNHNLSVQQYNGAYCFDAYGSQINDNGTPDAADDVNETVAPEDSTSPWSEGLPFAASADGDCANGPTPDSLSNTGGVFADDSIAIDGASKEVASLNGVNSSGLVGDARVGYDHARGRFLVGVFGSYGFNDKESELSGIGGIEGNGHAFDVTGIEKGDEWSVGLRAGYIVAPRTLLYILAAYTQTEYTFSGTDFGGAEPAGFSKDTTFEGVTVGGGVEFALASNVFLGIEGSHTFYGEETVLDTGGSEVGGFGSRIVDDLDETRVLATIKLKLNADLPSFGN